MPEREVFVVLRDHYDGAGHIDPRGGAEDRLCGAAGSVFAGMSDSDEQAVEFVRQVLVQRPDRRSYLAVILRLRVADVVADRVNNKEPNAADCRHHLAKPLDVFGEPDVPEHDVAALEVRTGSDEPRLHVDLGAVFGTDEENVLRGADSRGETSQIRALARALRGREQLERGALPERLFEPPDRAHAHIRHRHRMQPAIPGHAATCSLSAASCEAWSSSSSTASSTSGSTLVFPAAT